MVRFPRAPTELPMILMSVFKVGQDLASLKTRSCRETETVSGPGSWPSPFLSRPGQKPKIWEKHMATHSISMGWSQKLLWGLPPHVTCYSKIWPTRCTSVLHWLWPSQGSHTGVVVLWQVLCSVATSLLMWIYSMGWSGVWWSSQMSEKSSHVTWIEASRLQVGHDPLHLIGIG